MVGINKVILVGNLGSDPVVNNTQSGTKVVNLNVATSDSWKDRNTGERKDRTEWHRVVIFNPQLADTAERYLRKGSKVYLEGQLQTRKWTDNNGVDRYTTEVVLQSFNSVLVMLDSKTAAATAFLPAVTMFSHLLRLQEAHLLAGITARLLLRQIWMTIFRFNQGIFPKRLRILSSGVSLF